MEGCESIQHLRENEKFLKLLPEHTQNIFKYEKITNTAMTRKEVEQFLVCILQVQLHLILYEHQSLNCAPRILYERFFQPNSNFIWLAISKFHKEV